MVQAHFMLQELSKKLFFVQLFFSFFPSQRQNTDRPTPNVDRTARVLPEAGGSTWPSWYVPLAPVVPVTQRSAIVLLRDDR
jgi:hypothetical protein